MSETHTHNPAEEPENQPVDAAQFIDSSEVLDPVEYLGFLPLETYYGPLLEGEDAQSVTEATPEEEMFRAFSLQEAYHKYDVPKRGVVEHINEEVRAKTEGTFGKERDKIRNRYISQTFTPQLSSSIDAMRRMSALRHEFDTVLDPSMASVSNRQKSHLAGYLKAKAYFAEAEAPDINELISELDGDQLVALTDEVLKNARRRAGFYARVALVAWGIADVRRAVQAAGIESQSFLRGISESDIKYAEDASVSEEPEEEDEPRGMTDAEREYIRRRTADNDAEMERRRQAANSRRRR